MCAEIPPQTLCMLPGLISIKWKAETTGTSKGNWKDRRKKRGVEEQGWGRRKGRNCTEPASVCPSCKLEALLGGVHGRPAKAIDFICGQRCLFLFHTNFHGQRSIKMAETPGRESVVAGWERWGQAEDKKRLRGGKSRDSDAARHAWGRSPAVLHHPQPQSSLTSLGWALASPSPPGTQE